MYLFRRTYADGTMTYHIRSNESGKAQLRTHTGTGLYAEKVKDPSTTVELVIPHPISESKARKYRREFNELADAAGLYPKEKDRQ